MKKKATKSLRTKLFLLLAGIVSISLALNTLQSSISFYGYMEDEVKESLTLNSQSSAALIRRTLSRYRSEISSSMQKILPANFGGRKAQMNRMIKSNKEIISFLIIRKKGSGGKTTVENFEFSKNIDDPRFEDQTAQSVQKKISRASIKWAKKFQRSGNSLLIQPIPTDSNFQLPMLNVGIKFPVSKSKDSIIAIMTIWQSEIIDLLGNSNNWHGLLVNRFGTIIVNSQGRKIEKVSKISDSEIFAETKNSKSKSGFVKNYTLGNERFYGSFTRIPKMNGLIVISQKRASSIAGLLKKSIVESSAWALFFILCSIGAGFVASTGMVVDFKELNGLIAKIASGDFSHLQKPKSRNEIGAAGSMIVQMAHQIQANLKATIAKARLDKELDTSKAVQTTMLPKNDIQTQNISIAGFYQSAEKCGGDLWGHYTIADDIELIYVGDAMGHGSSAAIATAICYSAISTITDQISGTAEKGERDFESPSKYLERMNRVIYSATDGKISVTFFVAIVDLKTGRISYSNAGHNFPILIPDSPGDSRRAKPSRVLQKISPISPVSLNAQGSPLGVDENARYEDKSLPLAPGDKIFFYSDGLIKCQSPKGRPWSHRSLMTSILQNAKGSHLTLKDKVIETAFKYFSSTPTKDDVTIVVAQISKSWSASVTSKDLASRIQLNMDLRSKAGEIAAPEKPKTPEFQEQTNVAPELPVFSPESDMEIVSFAPGSVPDSTPKPKSLDSENIQSVIPSGEDLSAVSSNGISIRVSEDELTPIADSISTDITRSIEQGISADSSDNRGPGNLRLDEFSDISGKEVASVNRAADNTIEDISTKSMPNFEQKVPPKNNSLVPAGSLSTNPGVKIPMESVESTFEDTAIAETQSLDLGQLNSALPSAQMSSEKRNGDMTKEGSRSGLEEKVPTNIKIQAGFLSGQFESSESTGKKKLAPAGILSSISLSAATDSDGTSSNSDKLSENPRKLPPVPRKNDEGEETGNEPNSTNNVENGKAS